MKVKGETIIKIRQNPAPSMCLKNRVGGTSRKALKFIWASCAINLRQMSHQLADLQPMHDFVYDLSHVTVSVLLGYLAGGFKAPVFPKAM